MTSVNFYKDDIVYHCDPTEARCYLGTVTKSENIYPDTLEGLLDFSESESSLSPTSPVLNKSKQNNSDVSVKQNEASNNSTKESKIHVTWSCLTSGDDHSSNSCPVPCVIKPDQLTVLERDHTISDIVCDARTGRLGSIVCSRPRAIVELLSYGRALFDLDCSRLRSVDPWSSRTSENRVTWRGWLGRVVSHRSLAIIRFSDGARLLVREENLRDFDPIPPTSSAFPDPIFEGAWLRGTILSLKVDGFSTEHTNSARCHYQKRHWRCMAPQNTRTDIPLPCGHPSLLRRELLRCSVTRPLVQKPDGLSRVLGRLPLFLHETAKRNALWFSRQRTDTTVSVFVECLLPVEATVHWLACSSSVPSMGRPPPTVIRGDDLANLKPIHPYPHLFSTTRDIWYLQLNESDVLYNLKAYDSPEGLLYDWFNKNEENLRAVRMQVPPASEPNSPEHLTTETKPDARICTPLWAQRALLNYKRRRFRVFANFRQRITNRETNFRSGEAGPRLHVFLANEEDNSKNNEKIPPHSDKTDKIHTRETSRSKSHHSSTQDSSAEVSSSSDISATSIESLNKTLHIRESHLAPLRAGTWVAVGIYSNQTEFDVRWLDGTLEQGVKGSDLRPLYFNMDEHEFVPGTCVSLKTASEPSIQNVALEHSGDSAAHSEIPEGKQPDHSSHSIPRDYGLVLSVNPKERTCLVQWFRTNAASSTSLSPVGEPEEAGVYELSAPVARQLNYGTLVWVTSTVGSQAGRRQVAYIEDIIPSTGTIAVRWPDGSKSEVPRSDCVVPVNSSHDGDLWSSDEDSDDLDLDELTSDYDSEWETVSDTSSVDEKAKPEETQRGTANEETSSENETVPYDSAIKSAAELVRQSYSITSEAYDLFQNPRMFAFCTFHRFVHVPAELDNLIYPIGTLLGAAATELLDSSSRMKLTFSLSDLCHPCTGELITPSPPLDLQEESELYAVTERLRSLRETLHEAYNLVHDFRIQRLLHNYDPRRYFSDEYVNGILQSIELASMSSSDAPREVSDFQSADASSAISLSPLEPEQVLAMSQASLKVLVTDSFNSTEAEWDSWNNRVRFYKQVSNTTEISEAYLVVCSALFNQLSHYLNTTHKRLLEELDEFRNKVLAWLSEVAPNSIQLLTEDVAEANAPSDESSKPSLPAASLEPIAGASSLDDSHLSSHPSISLDVIPTEYRGEFVVEDAAPKNHRFYRKSCDALSKSFHKAWRRDTALLSTSLPNGVIVKSFSDLINLFSLLIVGPAGTPYEHGLFLFDIYLPENYPNNPPQVHYYSFATERINPNLYVDGNVCLSLLGTWAGKGTENWDPVTSNLLQLVVSIQGLILNAEPYFNEAGFEACRGAPESVERSRVYNESVVATLVQSTLSLLRKPLPVFEQEIVRHFKRCATKYALLLEFWSSLDEEELAKRRAEQRTSQSSTTLPALPEFPLAPVTKGFQISVRRNRLAFLDLVASLPNLEQPADHQS